MRRILLWLIVALAVMIARPVWANGGQIRVSNETVGPYKVTVFTSPSPLREGPIDVSVYVADQQERPVEDAQVTVTTEPLGHEAPGGSYPATRDQATNRLFYAAKFTLPAEGQWRMMVEVDGPLGRGTTTFDVEAGAAGAINLRLLITLLALVPLAVAWWMARAQRRRLRSTQPAQERSP